MSFRRSGMSFVAMCAAFTVGGSAMASTINQNTSWTIDRSTSTTKYRVVAYGDSIYAGYNGGIGSVGRRAAPVVQGEYLAQLWNTDMEVIRRTKSGAKADDIYNNKIVSERSYMQATNTRVVMFEMCGNDYLQARSAFTDQTGTCSYAGLESALAACASYTEKAMQAINQYATTAKVKIVSNIYYPGFNADNVLTGCTDSATGQKVNKRAKFLPLLARSNWKTCSLAEQYGFKCADSFAEMMGAEYDSNGDGQIDSEALRYRSGESESAYVTRITSTLVGTLRDANTHFVSSGTSYDYIQSDDTHPTYLGSTISVSIFSGSGSGTGAPQYTDSQVVGGKNPDYNKNGHDKMGWESSKFNPATP
ncbi:SGNH/GDSL hydrolase family protein [Pyxidicoccus parkwayensis]|uniref:SGNH/GDSL hydrolase family protein n=1 Tax=Pyxidicoccus parkwayensis TaxID=2813578 RepID=A0ABX7NZ14_9BACT|nr:SGNH/GDSL hydrolase family protein [Pyxidicoccus parkwaysis]QSQ21308.1 SGNH/GDSL hydrolase family protein [Pyxidicoccus parkwaysis]